MLNDDCDQCVDASGLRCPLPILRAKKALATMISGQILKVISTDPNALSDFTIFAEQTGNILTNQFQQTDQTFIFLRKR